MIVRRAAQGKRLFFFVPQAHKLYHVLYKGAGPAKSKKGRISAQTGGKLMLVLRRRWKSRPAPAKHVKRNILIALLIFMLFSIQSFIYIEKNLKPPLMNLAKIRIKQLATQSINTAITERMSQGTNYDKLIDWRTDASGKVTGFTLNYAEHMKITSDTITTVDTLLKNLKEIPEHIPLGQAMNSAILASFGPDIPIRLVPAGAVKVDLSTRYQNAGINMILVEVYLRIIAEVTIIIPFDSEPEIVETEVPISYSLVVGDVPTYYFDGKGNPVGGSSGALPPSISLPGLHMAPSGKNEAPKAEESSAGVKK
ncbi:sporulation protein YunB [Paenibacillus hamazuiensis]|uniref:sporulation protein YunB n=1 Tax=Paenibacillus hamazuiensis TaxID=2936508 RepID=UPI00200E66D3|nr:sporulation protein YunB [Paenibacillus hamazuiensis]